MEPDVKFISDEIKRDIDTMPVQIFTDLPGDNPFQLAPATQEGDVLVHGQTQPVYQQLTIEDPHSDVTQALEGRYMYCNCSVIICKSGFTSTDFHQAWGTIFH